MRTATDGEEGLHRALLRWFARAARDLPWRRLRTPWRTWVSELMLQQTTVATVVPRFEEFVRRFPDVASLAAATEREVVEAWAGLGYYARARNLHRAARAIVERHGGAIPRTLDTIRTLPGIGAYTAGAILSLSWGVPVPCVDGNVRRVLARIDGRDRGARDLEKRAESLVPPDRPGEWNEALMELGATVCRPADPDCPHCPLASRCVARREGTVSRLPGAKPRAATVAREASYALILREGAALLCRRPPGPLGDLWEFPGDRVPRAKLPAILRAGLGIRARVGKEVSRARHTITHHRISAALYETTLDGDPAPAGYPELAWIPLPELQARPLTAASRKLATALILARSRILPSPAAAPAPSRRLRE